MWLITDEGFLSVVSFDPSKDKAKRSNRQVKSWGRNPVLVRARVKADLEQLRPYWSKLRIEADLSADYEWRAVMPRTRWADFLAHKGAEIDYDSHFKEVVQSRSTDKDGGARRHSAMMGCWTELSTLQDNPPYGWGKGKYGTTYADWWASYGGSGYTGTGKKGAKTTTGTAVNSQFSGLCTSYIKQHFAGGKEKTLWCDYMKGHAGTHSYQDKEAVSSFSTTKPSNTIASQVVDELFGSGEATGYDSTNPYNKPDTVIAMCQELMKVSPEEIADQAGVDEATPYETYELWHEALCASPKNPLTGDELVKILEEMAEDYRTTKTAAAKYREALDKYSAFGEGHEIPDDTNPIVLEHPEDKAEDFPADCIVGG